VQDAKDKHDEIGQMDKIYQQAKMTIVAVYGTDADAGLPGVRPKSRLSSQHVVNLQGMKISNVLPGLENAVDAALWNTRAWTYQERLLSNRKLYFCKDQVFFECDHGQYREDMLIDPHSNTQPSGVTYNTDPKYGTPHKIVRRNKLNLHVYEEIVFEYGGRGQKYRTYSGQ
jgi:Heterokaryon incompatibility protein (HET)